MRVLNILWKYKPEQNTKNTERLSVFVGPSRFRSPGNFYFCNVLVLYELN